MRIIKPVDGRKICIGRQGENERTMVVFDVAAWLEEYPTATISLFHRRSGDIEAYPCADVSVDNGELSWIVTAADTAKSGGGVALMYITQGDVIAKSVQYKTEVLHAETVGEDIPDPLEEYAAKIMDAQLAVIAEDDGEGNITFGIEFESEV